MPTEIVRHLSPEEQELARKRQELAILQAELTDRELFLANLQAELAAFEGRYCGKSVCSTQNSTTGTRRSPSWREADGSNEAKSAAAEARGRQRVLCRSHGEAAKAADFSPSPELKKLFREVVRQIHPDNAADDADRAVRNRLMQRPIWRIGARCGCAEKNPGGVQESPESVKGEGVGADLVRVLRQIDRIVKRLAQIEPKPLP